MEDQYIEITFETGSPGMNELLSAVLYGAEEIEGFEETQNTVIAYIPLGKYDGTFFERYVIPERITYSTRMIENRNWNQVWESEFKPVIVEDFVTIRAHFHSAEKQTLHEIIITPKMSFGTGHHATTWLMMNILRKLDCRGKKVADFGTGTGILAILSSRLGALQVLAIDYDDCSIQNAAENIAMNECDNIDLLKTDAFPSEGPWDIIMANINLHTLLDNFERFSKCLNRDGRLIVSGILQKDMDILLAEANRFSLNFQHSLQKDGWMCMTFTI